MPFPSTETVDRPALEMSYWWLGPLSIKANTSNQITVVTSARRGDETGPSYHPDDMREIYSADLAGELAGDPEGLALIAEINTKLEIIAGKLMDLRNIR